MGAQDPFPRLRAAFAAAALVVLPACSRQSAARSDADRPGSVFRLAIKAEPSDLDPNSNISADTEPLFTALYEGLVTLGSDGKTILPGVAQRWDNSSDGLVYTFHLRDNARWSNGATVTADDFLFSFRRVFDPLMGCEESSFGYMIAGAEAYNSGKVKDVATVGVSAPDRRTLVVRLAHPSHYFLSVLAIGTPFLPVYPPLVEQFDGVHHRGRPWTREGKLVSNGPFMLAAWKPDSAVVVTPNPHYWDKAAVKLNAIRFLPTEDPNTQERGFRTGQFDVTNSFPRDKVAAYAGQNPTPLRISPILQVTIITFNVARYGDPRVRRALSLALDRARIIPAVFGPFGTPAYSLCRPGSGGYSPPASSACQFDPAQAKRLLAQAGFPGGKGFAPIDLMLVGNAQEAVRLGEAVQQSWKNVLGVVTRLQPTEPKVYLDAERTRQFSMVIERWQSSWDDPTAVYLTGESTNPNNDCGWANARFDAAFRESNSTVSQGGRVRDFNVQESILADEVPYAPLFFTNRGALVGSAVRGWRSNPVDHVNWKQISLERGNP
jgi:oligopeptide transport system substrate-binding protein